MIIGTAGHIDHGKTSLVKRLTGVDTDRLKEEKARGISIALDGSIVNGRDLRSQLTKRGYQFTGKSDAELLLRAYQQWDKEVVKHLRGAFAFAIWDSSKERLMLARDRFGQKPLHLHQAGGAVCFASEVKALVRAPGVKVEIDTAAVSEYLAQRYVRGPRTLLAGVRKLVPGTYALWQFGTLRETRYWSPPDGEAPIARGPANPVEGFIERLDEAVHLSMQTPRVGVLLSGGYDSAAIVALARAHHDHVTTFSAGFADDKRSELAAAGRVAQHFGTQHHEIVLERRDVLAKLPQLVASRDAPVSRPADVALHLLAREAARKVKVALSGDGGDEILGGYRRHTFLRGFAPASMTTAKRVNGLFVIPVADPRMPLEEGRASALRSILFYEQTGWLADNLLERSDRMTAAASLELRMPFLDHRVAEYVSALPDSARVRGLSTKWILRQADRRLIGDANLKPRKAGFRIPVGDLMREQGVLDQLRGAGSLTRAYYDGKVLDRLLDEQLSGKRNHEETLWTLLNLEIWSRTLSDPSRRR